MKTAIAAIVTTLTLLLAGCAGGGEDTAPTVTPPLVTVTVTPTPTTVPSATRDEDAFLLRLSNITGISDYAKLHLGNEACDLLEQGHTPQQVGQEMSSDLVIAGFGPESARTLGLAIADLCPSARG